MNSTESFNSHLNSLTQTQWKSFFDYIDKLENINQISSIIVHDCKTLPYTSYNQTIDDLLETIVSLELLPEFDCLTKKQSRLLVEDGGSSKLEAITVCCLFKVMIRKERFVQGSLAEWFESGFIVKLLKRLQELYQA